MQPLQKELDELNVIKHALNAEKNKHEVHLLTILVKRLEQSLRNKEIKFYALYSSKNQLEHINTYKERAKMYKNKAIAKLQDLTEALTRKEITRANAILDELLDTDFFTKDTEKHLSKWKNSTRTNFQRNYFTV
ncbi:hypothetical protein [Oceanobacillus halotolerans]|uniref:hypothetical protein n=1 Tax=Oceanobacillus halotolerans TaxID=2663380 RepID=UPI0013DA43C4|nr:hypothetical protein [Oceanobacillus halotolerans]